MSLVSWIKLTTPKPKCTMNDDRRWTDGQMDGQTDVLRDERASNVKY